MAASPIADAFVRVFPKLAVGFKGMLVGQIEAALKKPITVPLEPILAPRFRQTLQDLVLAETSKKPLVVPVELVPITKGLSTAARQAGIAESLAPATAAIAEQVAVTRPVAVPQVSKAVAADVVSTAGASARSNLTAAGQLAVLEERRVRLNSLLTGSIKSVAEADKNYAASIKLSEDAIRLRIKNENSDTIALEEKTRALVKNAEAELTSAKSERENSLASTKAATEAAAATKIRTAGDKELAAVQALVDKGTVSLSRNRLTDAQALTIVERAQQMVNTVTAEAVGLDQAAAAAKKESAEATLTNANELLKNTKAANEAVAATTRLSEANKISAKLSGDAAKATAAQSAELNKQVIAQQRASRAAAEQSASTQATLLRGAGATGLSGLGIRGATLAASTPFLLGAAGVTVISLAAKDAANFQKQLLILQATAHATGEQMKVLSETAKQLGNDLKLPGVSAADAVTALNELVRSGFSVDEALQAVSGTLLLSRSASLQTADAVDSMVKVLDAFHLSGTDAAHVADVLTNAAANSLGTVSDFAAALGQVGPVAHHLGISLTETTAILTGLSKGGLEGQAGAAALRTSLLRLAAPTTQAQAVLKEFGITLRDAQGNLRPDVFAQFGKVTENMGKQLRDAVLAAVFGNRALRAAQVATSPEFANLTAKIEAQGSASDLAQARVHGFSGQLEQLKKSASSLGVDLGSQLLPAFTNVGSSLKSLLGLSDQLTNTFGKTVIKPVLGTFTAPILAGVAAFEALTGAVFLYNKATDRLAITGQRAVEKRVQETIASGKLGTVDRVLTDQELALAAAQEILATREAAVAEGEERIALARTQLNEVFKGTEINNELINLDSLAAAQSVLFKAQTDSTVTAEAQASATKALGEAFAAAGLSAEADAEKIGILVENLRILALANADARISTEALNEAIIIQEKANVPAARSLGGLLSPFGLITTAVVGLTFLLPLLGHAESDTAKATDELTKALDALNASASGANLIAARKAAEDLGKAAHQAAVSQSFVATGGAGRFAGSTPIQPDPFKVATNSLNNYVEANKKAADKIRANDPIQAHNLDLLRDFAKLVNRQPTPQEVKVVFNNRSAKLSLKKFIDELSAVGTTSEAGKKAGEQYAKALREAAVAELKRQAAQDRSLSLIGFDFHASTQSMVQDLKSALHPSNFASTFGLFNQQLNENIHRQIVSLTKKIATDITTILHGANPQIKVSAALDLTSLIEQIKNLPLGPAADALKTKIASSLKSAFEINLQDIGAKGQVGKAAVQNAESIINGLKQLSAQGKPILQDLGTQLMDSFSLGIGAGAQKAIKAASDAVTQAEQAAQQAEVSAVQTAKSNLGSIANSLSGIIGNVLDARAAAAIAAVENGPLGKEINRIQAALDRTNFAAQRSQLEAAIGTATDAASRRQAEFQLQQADLQHRVDILNKEKTARENAINNSTAKNKAAITQRLNDLADEFAQGKIKRKQFQDDVVALLRTYRISYKTVGNLLGEAAGSAFQATFKALLTQALELTGFLNVSPGGITQVSTTNVKQAFAQAEKQVAQAKAAREALINGQKDANTILKDIRYALQHPKHPVNPSDNKYSNFPFPPGAKGAKEKQAALAATAKAKGPG